MSYRENPIILFFRLFRKFGKNNAPNCQALQQSSTSSSTSYDSSTCSAVRVYVLQQAVLRVVDFGGLALKYHRLGVWVRVLEGAPAPKCPREILLFPRTLFCFGLFPAPRSRVSSGC